MNFLTRLGQRWDNFRFQYSLRPQEVNEFRNLLDEAKNGSGYFSSWIGNTSGENISSATAMRISTWFTCLQVRWDSIAMLPFNVYAVDGSKKRIAYEHPAYILHTRPNATMTPTQFWKLVQQRRDNNGNCFCPIMRDGNGRIISINIITDNSKVKLYCSKETGELYYEYDGKPISSADMLHFKGLTTDGKTGLSLTEYHQETVGRLRAIQKFSNRSITKTPGMYATSASQVAMNETQKKAFKDYWTREMAAFNAGGDLPVLYNGFELKTAGANPKDVLYLEQINATKEDIYGITKVPPKLAQNFQTGTTYNNSEQQSLDFLVWTMTPNIKDIEDECNYKLFTDQERAAGYFCKFNEKAILRLDAKTQSEVMDTNFRNGTASINENRDILDLNPIENGDDHYIELNNFGPVRLQDEILAKRNQPAAMPSGKRLNGHELPVG